MNEGFVWGRRCSRKLRDFVEQDTDDEMLIPGNPLTTKLPVARDDFLLNRNNVTKFVYKFYVLEALL